MNPHSNETEDPDIKPALMFFGPPLPPSGDLNSNPAPIFFGPPLPPGFRSEGSTTTKASGKQRAQEKPMTKELRSVQDLLDELTLKRTPSYLPKNATEKEKQEDRKKRLLAQTTKHRSIFLEWPRDPEGKTMIPRDTLPGKSPPGSGLELWGATLLDFYWTAVVPDILGARTISTGSKLAAWCKENGENLSYAKDEMNRASFEAEPEKVSPCSISRLIRDTEQISSFAARPWKVHQETEGLQFGQFEPFSSMRPLPRLQERIPLRLLPRKLIVHDPFNVLEVDKYQIRKLHDRIKEDGKPFEWRKHSDITHVYRLQLSEEGRGKVRAEEAKIKSRETEYKEALEKLLKEQHSTCLTPSIMENAQVYHPCDSGKSEPESGPCQTMHVILHEPPPTPAPIEEAHVYISPVALGGEGNHSFVFNVEWELPRSLLVEDIFCGGCMTEKTSKIMEEQDAQSDDKWEELRGEMQVEYKHRKEVVIGVQGSTIGKDESGGDHEDLYLLQEGGTLRRQKYQGPVRIINTGVERQNGEQGPYCAHQAKKVPDHPLTARVSVTAKLSKADDSHLVEEAQRYQQFPTRFFQHWSGYTVLPPLHDPVPVGAIVPQFYGYYVPDENEPPVHEKKPETCGDKSQDGAGGSDKQSSTNPGCENKPPKYRSPLLLLENCGSPLNVDELSVDDINECASLFYRFHGAGWVHNSVYARNVLVQPGPLSYWPVVRNFPMPGTVPQKSFRLIDFGRSFKDEGSYRICDRRRVDELLGLS